jgi:hypothetical protein
VRLVTLAFAGMALVMLTGCDPSADFVIGSWDNGGHRFVIDAWSGPSGENAQGTLKLEGDLFGTVGCLQITASEARVGLDLSPSLGLTALALITDNGAAPGDVDVVRLTPSGLAASNVCAAELEPGPPQPGNFIVRDLVPK